MNHAHTESLRRRDREVLWHPYTRRSVFDATDFPVIERGEGIYLYDTDGAPIPRRDFQLVGL